MLKAATFTKFFLPPSFWVSPKGTNEFVLRAGIIVPVERKKKTKTLI
jgi:hypothetical protein